MHELRFVIYVILYSIKWIRCSVISESSDIFNSRENQVYSTFSTSSFVLVYLMTPSQMHRSCNVEKDCGYQSCIGRDVR